MSEKEKDLRAYAYSGRIEELKKIPQITKVMSLTGDYDALAEIIVETPEELYEIFANKIDMINGITASNTHMVMKEFSK